MKFQHDNRINMSTVYLDSYDKKKTLKILTKEERSGRGKTKTIKKNVRSNTMFSSLVIAVD